MEMTPDMMKAGKIADSARATQIEEQAMQDWKNRNKLSKKWGKMMQGRSRVRIRALKSEPYNKPTVWVGSKVTKPGAPIQKTAPLHMIWKTHVVGDAIVQTCGKAGRGFTKWTRRMPNVPCAVPANWTSWPENEEHHEYGYAGKDAWANEQSLRYMQEMDEVFHPGIPSELHQAVLERTLKIVQELIGHGSDLKELKNKVWTVSNANRQCSSCGIYVSDKPEHGKQRCRGARNTTAKFNGQCCRCRFDVSTMDNCVTASHSCHTCKRRRHRWAATLVSRGEQILMESPNLRSLIDDVEPYSPSSLIDDVEPYSPRGPQESHRDVTLRRSLFFPQERINRS
jgi:hypothetical protein